MVLGNVMANFSKDFLGSHPWTEMQINVSSEPETGVQIYVFICVYPLNYVCLFTICQSYFFLCVGVGVCVCVLIHVCM